MSQDEGISSTSDRTTFAEPDNYDIGKKLSKLAAYLKDLHSALPTQLWPHEEAAPLESHEGCVLYPGRVLIGRLDGRAINAYLMKISESGNTVMEYYYSDTGYPCSSRNIAFKKIQFEPWCHLLGQQHQPTGSSGTLWEARVKNIVKCAMLEAKHFDGAVSPDDFIPKLIRSNLERDAHEPIPELSTAHSSQSARVVVEQPLSAKSPENCLLNQPKTVDTISSSSLLTPKSGSGAPKTWELKSTGGIDPIVMYTDTLHKIVPPDAWFRVQALSDEEKVRIKGSKPQSTSIRLCSGKVLVGHYRDSSGPNAGLSVWGTVKFRPNDTVSFFLFSDVVGRMDLPQKLSNPIEFERVFCLLAEGEIVADSQYQWQARVGTCVKVALIEAGHLQKSAFTFHSVAAPPALRRLIARGLVREKHPQLTEKIASNTHNDQDSPEKLSLVVALRVGTARMRRIVEVTNDSNSYKAIEADQSASLNCPDVETVTTRLPHPSLETAQHHVLTAEQDGPGIVPESLNKKRKLSIQDPLSLLNFVRQATSTDPTSYAALEQQVRNLTAEKAKQEATNDILRSENGLLEQKCNQLTSRFKDRGTQNNILMKRIEQLSGLEERNKALEEFQAAHVKYCQPVMLEMMKKQQMSTGSDEKLAMQDAETLYKATYGLEVSKKTGKDV